MSTLVAIAYPDIDTARTVAAELHDLEKEKAIEVDAIVIVDRPAGGKVKLHHARHFARGGAAEGAGAGMVIGFIFLADRQSTRLNSSHTIISYAVFCLKK